MAPTLRSLALVALSLSSLAASAAAQVTEKQAVAEVKKASKSQLALLKQTGKTSLASLDATLDVFEAQLDETSTPLEVVQLVANALQFLADDMAEAKATALGFVEGQALFSLEDLAAGGDLQGIYPDDLYYGTGGVLDQHRVKVDQALAKVHAGALSRLKKTVKLAEAEAGIGVAFVLRLGTDEEAFVVNADDTAGLALGVRLDVVASASRLADGDDGLLLITGRTDSSDDVTVGYYRPSDSEQETVSVFDERFAALFGSPGGLAEGGYAVHAKQGTGGTFHSTASIGIR